MNNTITIARKSPFTGKVSQMTLPISEEDFNRRATAWQNGTFIQDAFPMLDAGQREFIKTGITPEEWDNMFGED
jgi:deoxyribodipyrimidine photolyase